MNEAILDTNVIIAMTRGEIELADPPERLYITAQTLGELSAGPVSVRNDPRELGRRVATLRLVDVMFRDAVLHYDEAAVREYGSVVADVIAAGRVPRRRVVDLQIAAIAISHDMPLYTANPDDFAGIQRLHLEAVVS